MPTNPAIKDGETKLSLQMSDDGPAAVISLFAAKMGLRHSLVKHDVTAMKASEVMYEELLKAGVPANEVAERVMSFTEKLDDGRLPVELDLAMNELGGLISTMASAVWDLMQVNEEARDVLMEYMKDNGGPCAVPMSFQDEKQFMMVVVKLPFGAKTNINELSEGTKEVIEKGGCAKVVRVRNADGTMEDVGLKHRGLDENEKKAMRPENHDKTDDKS